jgi:hypothetical protein
MKTIYYFKNDTKEYLSKEIIQDFQPYASNAVEIPVPSFEENEIAVWNGEFWEIKEDHRGKTVYLKEDGNSIKVDWIGKINNKYTIEKPEDTSAQYWNNDTSSWEFRKEWLIKNINNKVKNLLEESDWTQLLDSPITEEERIEWAHYRNKLRQVKKQPSYPFVIQWPEIPEDNNNST